MTLRVRTALAVLAVCTVAVVVLYFTLQGILAARFTTLERQKASQDLGRASDALTQEIGGSQTANDYLSPEKVQQLSEATSYSLELHQIQESDLPADFEAAKSALSEDQTSLVRVLDGNTIAAYALLTDIEGNPAYVLRLAEPRNIYAQGRQTILIVLCLLIGFGLLSSVLAIIGIDRLVLSRMRRLKDSVEATGGSSNLSERVSVGGRDEITAVADAINKTRASLEKSHRDLVETEAKNRALVDAIPDLMFRINGEGKIVEIRRPRKAKTATDSGGSLPGRGIPDELIDLLPTQIQEMAMPHVTAALQSGETQVFEFQLALQNRMSHYEARVLAGYGEDALVMVRDVTEQKHEEEARQKSVLLKEIHHRVKNNLQVISGLLYLQARRTNDTKLIEVLNESSNRVKSVALIHQRLQQSKDTVSVELSEYIRDLTTVLLHSCGRDTAVIKLSLDLEKSVIIGIDTAVPCGLIVNEIVSNSLKHAFPDGHGGDIKISLHTDDADLITLVIGDNGVGLPNGLDFRKADSLGLQLVMSLVSQLNGSIDVDATSGTRFTIRFRDDSVHDTEKSSREAACAGAASA